MRTVQGYDFFNHITAFDIVWEEFCPDLFNYTFALGIDHKDRDKLSLLSVQGSYSKDRYDTINTYFLNGFANDPDRLTECIKKDIAKYLKECLTNRVAYGTITMKQVIKLSKKGNEK
jgi:hypothetical protein